MTESLIIVRPMGDKQRVKKTKKAELGNACSPGNPHLFFLFVGCVFGIIGVDIELPAVRRRADLRRRVLTPKECGSLGRVDGVTTEEEVLLRFSIKEAVYKAAHPFLHRPLGFKDVGDVTFTLLQSTSTTFSPIR